jgi:hypothetical protein
MPTNADLWETEVELATAAFACSGNEDAFREDMRRLGFMADEIEKAVKEAGK